MTRLPLIALLLTTLLIAGCYTPQGGLMSSSTGALTYYSTAEEPKTIMILDMRNGENIFEMKIPVGKQLVMQFHDESGDDAVYTPDLMKYEVMEIGTSFGSLNNSITVPNAYSRRIDVFIRQGEKYEAPEPNRPLRTDEMGDRPAGWTPAGGKDDYRDDPMTTYDD
ncbi:MAG: hypothetical protein P8I74_05655 [Phycisphaerales bacterium]|nr:hypothetical protein [Phycisphaerales bacterium]|tara:strand:- start:1169 stop:1666 length:498 start_codon:yes stop_codon:yes gene_type:complete